jgi:hypothetical protein
LKEKEKKRKRKQKSFPSLCVPNQEEKTGKPQTKCGEGWKIKQDYGMSVGWGGEGEGASQSARQSATAGRPLGQSVT